MRKNSIPTSRGKFQISNFKLINFIIIGLVFCFLTFLPLLSEAAYKIYLKNGRLMTGISWVKEEGERIKIYKRGIILELLKTNILKIEEYKADVIEEESVEEKLPSEESLPEYLRYEETFEEEGIKGPLEMVPEEEEVTEEKTKEGLRDTGAGEFKEGELKPGPQLEELRKLEQEEKLPEQFKSYKDFLEERYKEQKKHVEGE